MRPSRYWASILFLLSTSADATSLWPDTGFVQGGAGTDTDTVSLGVTWNDPSPLAIWSAGTLTLSGEVSVGRWRTSESSKGSAHSWTSQVSLTPTLRFWPALAHGWYGEMGIGTSYLNPLFTDGTRHFSTRFNFDDHLGLGYRWGGEASHFGSQEVTLRLEHFSNAGLREPNPGMNFIELRYGHDL